MARLDIVGGGCRAPDPADPAVLAQPLGSPAVLTERPPELLWRTVWLLRLSIDHEFKSDAVETYESDVAHGEIVSRPGYSISDYLQGYSTERHRWETVRKTERTPALHDGPEEETPPADPISRG